MVEEEIMSRRVSIYYHNIWHDFLYCWHILHMYLVSMSCKKRWCLLSVHSSSWNCVCPTRRLSLFPKPFQWGSSLGSLLGFSTSWFHSSGKSPGCSTGMFWVIVFEYTMPLGYTARMKGISEVERISPYRVALMMPLNITICVVPFFEMPANTWTFGGCLWRYLLIVYVEHSFFRRIFFWGFQLN